MSNTPTLTNIQQQLVNVYDKNSSSCTMSNSNNQAINLSNLKFDCTGIVDISNLTNSNIDTSSIDCLSSSVTNNQILQQLASNLGLQNSSQIPSYLSSNGVVNQDGTQVTISDINTMITNVSSCLISSVNNQNIDLSRYTFTDCNIANLNTFTNSINQTIKETCIGNNLTSNLLENYQKITISPTFTPVSSTSSTPAPFYAAFGSETNFIIAMVFIGLGVLIIIFVALKIGGIL